MVAPLPVRGGATVIADPHALQRLRAQADIGGSGLGTEIAGKGIAHGVSPARNRSAVNLPAPGAGREISTPLPNSPPASAGRGPRA